MGHRTAFGQCLQRPQTVEIKPNWICTYTLPRRRASEREGVRERGRLSAWGCRNCHFRNLPSGCNVAAIPNNGACVLPHGVLQAAPKWHLCAWAAAASAAGITSRFKLRQTLPNKMHHGQVGQVLQKKIDAANNLWIFFNPDWMTCDQCAAQAISGQKLIFKTLFSSGAIIVKLLTKIISEKQFHKFVICKWDVAFQASSKLKRRSPV